MPAPAIIPGKRLPPSSGLKGKMKILPAHHYSQVSTSESIDSDMLGGSSSGGAIALEMQDTYH
jgi:hypothetical protein